MRTYEFPQQADTPHVARTLAYMREETLSLYEAVLELYGDPRDRIYVYRACMGLVQAEKERDLRREHGVRAGQSIASLRVGLRRELRLLERRLSTRSGGAED